MRQTDKIQNLEVRPLKNIEGGFLVWKELGETPLELLERVREQEQLGRIKMTYAGRLDPAAEGELLVLVGEACKQKDQFLGLDKTYQFQVLLEFETDTLDLLGVVTKFGSRTSKETIELYKNLEVGLPNNAICNLVGKHNWPYPAYCSKTYNGQAMWQYARDGEYQSLLENNLVPMNEFEVYDISYKKTEEFLGEEVLGRVQWLCENVTGDFRQVEILNSWQQSVVEDEGYQILKFEARVSSGTYVRQIAKHIGELLSQPTMAFSITRTQIHL